MKFLKHRFVFYNTDVTCNDDSEYEYDDFYNCFIKCVDLNHYLKIKDYLLSKTDVLIWYIDEWF